MRLAVRVGLVFLVCLSCTTALFADRAEGSFDRTLTVNGPVQLRVSTGSGGITMRKGAGNTVHIQARVTANTTWGGGGSAAGLVHEIEGNPPIRQTGNIITIGNDVQKWEHVGISYDLTVPADTTSEARTGSGNIEAYDLGGAATLSTGSGSVRGEGLGRVQASTGSGNVSVSRASGAVNARTGSGSIDVASVNGAVDAHTGSGNIVVSGATGNVRADAGSGRVRVEKAQHDVEARSASGGVAVDGAPRSARWDLQTGSGNVEVSVPRETGFELDAHTGSGSISTSHSVAVSGTMRRNELRGVAGRPDNHIYIRTGSGSVRID